MIRPRVVIESPYGAPTLAGIEANLTFARSCMYDSIHVWDEAPIGSHLIYTQPGILRDEIPEECDLGIELGYIWGEVAESHVFYTDLGWSSGMSKALYFCLINNRRIRIRGLEAEPQLPYGAEPSLVFALTPCIQRRSS